MSRRFLFPALILALGAASYAPGQGSSRPRSAKGEVDLDPPTQALPAEIDLPTAVTAETARLAFRVSPLSTKGLLLEQTRDALKSLEQASHPGRIVKLRAFVAGSADSRRVRQIVAEFFAGKKQALPALTTVQAGDLTKDGAQVVMESVSEESGKRLTNPHGLIFLPATVAADAKSAVEKLASAAAQAHAAPADVLEVTCFLGSIGDAPEAAGAAARAFPVAARNGSIDMIQRLRAPSGPATACEGVARGSSVTAAKLIFTGAQMAFGQTETDLRLAFTRLEKTLEPFGASYHDVVFAGFYPAGRAAQERLAPLTAQFLAHPAPPATTVVFEGLPSPDASMSLEVIAAAKGEGVRN